MSKPTRIVLRPELVDEAKELCNVTHAGSLSELVTILISRYGRHLKETWEIAPSTLIAQQNNAFASSPMPSIEPLSEFSDSIEL